MKEKQELVDIKAVVIELILLIVFIAIIKLLEI